MADLSEYQKDILVRTILGEARGEGIDGLEAVAQVIRNRSQSGRFPSDPAAVALQPSQFSVWNTGAGGGKTDYNKNSDLYRKAEQAVERVFSGQVPDRTNGALFYHTPAVSPNWAGEVNRYGTTRLGNHIFYNGRPTPPGEIPNQVASLTDTRRPVVAPSPVTISPDLAQMRNPEMSVSARNAQVTPSPNVPLPRARPSAPDIVTPSMARVGMAAQPNVRQASDIGLLNTNPVTPRLTDAGDNIYSYHIPDMTPTAVVGGVGSLTPSRNGPVPAQQSSQLASIRARDQDLQAALNARYPTRLPDISPLTPASSSLEQAARRAALTANQSYIDRTTPSIPVGSAVANVASQRAEQLGQRQATNIPMRLQPGTAAQNYDVSINGPAVLTRQQYASLPVNPTRVATPSRVASVPLSASARPIGMAAAPRTAAPSPLRIVVQREQQPVGMASPIQRLQQQGLTSAQAYDVLNAAARGSPSLEDRVSGRSGLSSSGASAYSLV